ncbi:hypothetical protein HH310_40180 [Actinoplanes sp. TBRC 11911]|uniref:hypothetical protein n=1 Tax=Actinoplanes sp. TBRC 11911 TaxID=2729386 RepID=UPI00145C3D47|nr:hypothetical protein [Actinoplanes sp. TBRC 11911]NMO57378.1 hypothetical protein [Actinoplanes sp. TBRC 11911]
MEDPFAGLEDWAKETERKVRREVRPPRPPRPPHARRRFLPVVLALVVAGIVVAVAVPRIRSWLPSGNGASAYATQAVPDGVTVTTTESAKPASPFTGTPAEAYPIAEQGITLPKATAVSGFTASEVDASLHKVRTAMIATRLDQAMLIAHNPKPFLAMVSPGQRDDLAGWFRDAKFSSLATWIYPAVHLDPAERPRVSGRVTYASAKVDGVQTLQITTNFVWVYAFTGPDRPLVTVHDQVRWEFPKPAATVAKDRGMWVADVQGYRFGVDCALAGQGLLAPTPQTAVPSSPPSEPAGNYMHTDHALDIADNCA